MQVAGWVWSADALFVTQVVRRGLCIVYVRPPGLLMEMSISCEELCVRRLPCLLVCAPSNLIETSWHN